MGERYGFICALKVSNQHLTFLVKERNASHKISAICNIFCRTVKMNPLIGTILLLIAVSATPEQEAWIEFKVNASILEFANNYCSILLP